MKLVVLLCSFVLAAALTAAPQTQPAPKKSNPSKTAAATKAPVPKKPAAKTAASSKSAAKTKASAKKNSQKAPATPASYRRGQTAPTPDRYREIQQALAHRGYFKNEPNGVWDQQSSDALKQFQTENNLTPTGKLTSRSLIQLGLGPKHEEESTVAPPAPVTAPAELPAEPAPVPVPAN